MKTKSKIPQLSARTRGWLQFLHRKATTPDDWSRQGQPHEAKVQFGIELPGTRRSARTDAH